MMATVFVWLYNKCSTVIGKDLMRRTVAWYTALPLGGCIERIGYVKTLTLHEDVSPGARRFVDVVNLKGNLGHPSMSQYGILGCEEDNHFSIHHIVDREYKRLTVHYNGDASDRVVSQRLEAIRPG
jgi:hypothetical protein